mgnify:FL=1
MNIHNLAVLKEMLHQTTEFFVAKGAVYQGDKIVLDATAEMRKKFVGFHDDIAHAETFREVAKLVNDMRNNSLVNNFFLPRTYVAYYERLIAVKVMAEEGLLENVEWWRSVSFQRKK